MIPSDFPSPDSLLQRYGSKAVHEKLFNFLGDGATSIAELHLQRFNLTHQLHFVV